MQNGLGASEAVSSTFPHEFCLRIQWQTALEPPRQFPLHFLIKSLLKSDAKWLWNLQGSYANWPWSLQGSFLYICLLNPYHKALQNGPGASKALSFTCPCQLHIQKRCKMALDPLRQFPLYIMPLSNADYKAMQTGPGASEAVSSTFPYWILLNKQCKMALEPLRQFPIEFHF